MNNNGELFGMAPDGAWLQWFPFFPSTPCPWPVVLLVHGGGFFGGGPPTTYDAAQDLANAGYLALPITYRLAPNGRVLHQPRTFNSRTTGICAGAGTDSTIHDQTDDVFMAVSAARNRPDCNGTVYIVGGSAGGSHAAFCSASGVSGDSQADGAACLSGAFQLEDFNDAYNTPAKNHAGLAFRQDVTNYCAIPNTNPSTTASLIQASPAHLSLSSCSPLFLISSVQDPMPTNQFTDMIAALNSAGKTVATWPNTGRFQSAFIPGDLHEFNYWYSPIDQQATMTVKQAVINFLNSLQ